MKHLSKICDAADWFDEDFKRVVKNELMEPPRFHRKQWEFAMIFLTLENLGLLKGDKIGLSLGGGNERVLYSIAKHIKKLIVTDLYDTDTTWDCARTEDPDEFIKASKPFPVDDEKLKAIRMDMRHLDFEDNKFDFCYSSCAVEHIGNFEDFVQHLNEVYRTLKEGGVYVFTTEFQFGNVTVKDPNNYIFSPTFLNYIFEHIKLTPVFDPDVSITENNINNPYPSNIKNLCYAGETSFAEKIYNDFPHLILLRGKHPFTSILFVLKKESAERSKQQVKFNNFAQSRRFIDEGFEKYKEAINNTRVSFNPFSMLPEGVSRFFLNHAEFFDKKDDEKNDDTLFHTDYFWLGSRERYFNFKMKINNTEPNVGNILQLRIHRYSTLNSENVECVFEKEINVNEIEEINEETAIEVSEDYNYALLAKMVSGKCKICDISLTSGITQNKNMQDEKEIANQITETIA